MLRSTGLVTIIAAFALAANGQACQGTAASCLDSNDSVILRCNSGSWSTENCPVNQGCMTMAPGMIHCMLRSEYTPTAAASGSSSAASPTATSAEKSEMDMSGMDHEESSGGAKASSSKASTPNGAESMQFVAALGFAVAGVAALF